jgi:hypothetical protein
MARTISEWRRCRTLISWPMDSRFCKFMPYSLETASGSIILAPRPPAGAAGRYSDERQRNTEQQTDQDGWRQDQNHHARTQAVVGHAVPLWENIDIIVLCASFAALPL